MTVPSELYERVALLEAQVRYLSERTQIPLTDVALKVRVGAFTRTETISFNGTVYELTSKPGHAC